MRFFTVKEVEAINQYIILNYSPGEPLGVKEPDLLESAVYRSQQSVFGKDAYSTIHEKAAALFEALAPNHPFHNANKRTAFVSLTQFLYYNGYDFEMKSQQEQENFTVDVVTKEITLEETSSIIREHTFKL